MSQSFFGTDASVAVDRARVIELAMGMALVAGAVLARRRYYRAHAGCRITVVLLNRAGPTAGRHRTFNPLR